MTPEENLRLLSLTEYVTILEEGSRQIYQGGHGHLNENTLKNALDPELPITAPLLAVVSSLSSAAVLAYIEKEGASELIVDPLTITIETGDCAKIAFERL